MRLKHFAIAAALTCVAAGLIVMRVLKGRAERKPTASVQVVNHSEDDRAKQWWHCGMHPQVIQDHPGDCPICHMALTPLKVNASGGANVTIDPSVMQNMGVRT